MNIEEYKQRIAKLLCRQDIAAAGVAASLAAHCVLVLSEQCVCDHSTMDAIERLEKMAGIGINENGEYYLVNP